MRVNPTSRRSQIEALGVVAVIRLKDAAKLRAVVDAMAEGGVRALEVTMTVPRAVELIGELAPGLPDGFLLGAGTVTDAETARRVIDARSSFCRRPDLRCRRHRGVSRARRRGDAGVFHADRDFRRAPVRRRHRESVSRYRAGSAVHQGRTGAAAAHQADAHRWRDAGQCRRLDPAPARSRSAWILPLDGKAIDEGCFDVITASTRGAWWPASPRRGRARRAKALRPHYRTPKDRKWRRALALRFQQRAAATFLHYVSGIRVPPFALDV